MHARSLSHVQLFATPWTADCQALLSMKFSKQEYFSGLPFPTPRDLPNPGIEPMSPASPALAGGFFTTEPSGKPCCCWWWWLFSHSIMSDSVWHHGLQHTRLPCPSLSPGVCSNSCPLSPWCHPTVSFSSCPQSFPASGSFPMSQPFTSGGQNIGASASASVLPIIIQGWFPLGLTGLISLLSKRLSRVFFSTTFQKHQFFSAHPSLWYNSHIHTWLLENHSFDYTDLCWQSVVSAF